MTAAAFTLASQSWPRVERTAAEWRVRFELLAAERWHVDGYDRAAARRWAHFETLAIWTEQDATARTLPNREAELLARAALAVLGIGEPGAERCIGLATRKGQAEGRIAKRGDIGAVGGKAGSLRGEDLVKPSDIAAEHELDAAYRLADNVTDAAFDTAIGEASR